MKITNNYDGSSGVYVCALPNEESKNNFLNIIKSTNPPFELTYFNDEAHMTLVYSRDARLDVDGLVFPNELFALPIKFEFWDGHDNDGYLVMSFISKPASDFHNKLLENGAKHSFDDYHPHMTIVHGINKNLVNDWIDNANKSFQSTLVKFDTIKISNCKK
jgi:hypothetical protein